MNTATMQSRVIEFLRLPLVMLVLFGHCNFHGASEAWNVLWTESNSAIAPSIPSVGTIIDLISGSLAPLANPFFFFISGVLFYREPPFPGRCIFINYAIDAFHC